MTRKYHVRRHQQCGTNSCTVRTSYSKDKAGGLYWMSLLIYHSITPHHLDAPRPFLEVKDIFFCVFLFYFLSLREGSENTRGTLWYPSLIVKNRGFIVKSPSILTGTKPIAAQMPHYLETSVANRHHEALTQSLQDL